MISCPRRPRTRAVGPAAVAVNVSERVADRYRLGHVLGSGAHSVVREAVCRRTGVRYAAKISHGACAAACEEAQILARCAAATDAVVKFVEAFEEVEQKCFVIVTELVEGGDLFAHMRRWHDGGGGGGGGGGGEHREEVARGYMQQLLSAVRAIHAASVVHRDIKPENIVVGDGGRVLKIIDFGTSALQAGPSPCLSTHCGSVNYMAPEVLDIRSGKSKRYGREADLWAAGVIMYILLFLQHPFATVDGEGVGKRTQRVCPKLARQGQYYIPADSRVSADAIDLVRCLLQTNPAARISAADALGHSFFTGGAASGL